MLTNVVFSSEELELLKKIRKSALYLSIFFPILGGIFFLFLGAYIAFLIYLLQANEALLLGFIVLFCLIVGGLCIRFGMHCLWKELPAYNAALRKGVGKKMLSGRIESTHIQKDRLCLQINQETVLVYVPFGAKIMRTQRYFIKHFRCLENEPLVLHLLPLPSGRQILLRTEYPNLPYKDTISPVQPHDTAETKKQFKSSYWFIFWFTLVIFSLFILFVHHDYSFLIIVAVVLAIAYIIMMVIAAWTKKEILNYKEIKTINGILTSVMAVPLRHGNTSSITYLLITISGRRYMLNDVSEIHKIACGTPVTLSFYYEPSLQQGLPLILTDGIKH